MKRIFYVLLALAVVVVIGFSLQQARQNNYDFLVETKAVCENTTEPSCPIRCHDEVFLNVSNSYTSIYKIPETICKYIDGFRGGGSGGE